MTYLYVIIILIISIKIYLKIAKSYSIVDHPNQRSSHNSITIRGGGIIFPIAVILWFILSDCLYPYFFMGFIIISIISFLDDIYYLKQYQRLMFQLISTCLLFYGLNLFILPIWVWLISFIFIIGWINSFNFMDGINGISVFYTCVCLATFYWIPELLEYRELINFIALSILVFGFYNVRKRAITFLGDVGSISIAFILAYLMLMLLIKTSKWEYILFFSVYGIDSVLTILQRLIQRENIFKPHKRHYYQYLVNKKHWSHLFVSGLYATIQSIINLILIFFIIPQQNSSAISIFLLIIFVLVYLIIKFMKIKLLFYAIRYYSPFLFNIGKYIKNKIIKNNSEIKPQISNARYCYSLWLRHLSILNKNSLETNPSVVAEFGPGESLGVGLMALLTGSKKYYALDIVKHTNAENNYKLLDKMIDLLLNKTDIPNEEEFPKLHPFLKSYNFPSKIITEQKVMNIINDKDRINHLKDNLLNIQNFNEKESSIYYICPWNDPTIIKNQSVDMIFSQAALEHVDDLRHTYEVMHCWLKRGGLMSHQIDFKSHGTSFAWNGHWSYNDFEWKLIRNNSKYLINREPLSTHIHLLKELGFKIKSIIPVKTYPSVQYTDSINRNELSKKYQNMSEDDFTTSSAHIISIKE